MSNSKEEPLSVKKSMLIIWAVGSLLWAGFATYMFKLEEVGYAYKTYDYFSEKVARGRNHDPMRWSYYQRGFDRARRMTAEANKNLGLFFLIGIGFPGVLLAVGTMALENVDKPKKRKKS